MTSIQRIHACASSGESGIASLPSRQRAIERRREPVERLREARARQCRVARELDGLVPGGQPQPADRRREPGGGVGQRGDVACGGARGDFGVACELAQLACADLLAEEQRRGVRQLVRLVEDDRVAVGQELGHALVAQHHVGEEQVVVDDDHVGVERLAPRLQHEAVGVVRAVLAEAVVAGGGDERPDRRVLGDVGQLRAVAALGRTREGDDLRQVADVVARRQAVLARGALEVVVADVVGAALEQRDRDGDGKRVAHQRQVALEELVLQCLGPRGDDHLAAVQQRGGEVRERLAGAGAGLGDELAARGDGAADGLRHRELLRTEAEAGERPRERAAVAEDGVERRIVGRGGRRAAGGGRRGAGHDGAQLALAVAVGLAFGLALGAAATGAAAPSGAVV